MNLREYQTQAIKALFDEFREGNRDTYIKIGTGGGKTFVSKTIFLELRKAKPNLKTLLVVPKNILIKQTKKAYGEGGIYNAEIGERDLSQSLTIASVQSIVKEKGLPKFDLVVFDEFHRARNYHKQLLAKIRTENPRAFLLGLTATDADVDPEFGAKKVYDMGLRSLTEQGYLAPLVLLPAKNRINVDNLRTQGDGYNAKDVKKELEGKIESQVKDMLENISGRKFIIIMCTTIEHAENVKEILGEGFLYHSKLKKEEKENNLYAWKSEGGFLVSVIAASEGFDHPPSDCIVFFRPIRSATLYEQAVGRIARKSEGKKNGLILDYGGVVDSLGLPYDIALTKKGNRRNHKECDSCGIANPLAASECNACGEAFMSLCRQCKSWHVYGTTCCEIKIDRFKNMTEEAARQKSPWREITNIDLFEHVSKKGNRCLKVVYRNGIFNTVCKEFFSFKNKDFDNFCSAIFGKNFGNPLDALDKPIYKIPKEILVKKVNGYDKVQSMKFY